LVDATEPIEDSIDKIADRIVSSWKTFFEDLHFFDEKRMKNN
jgi:hypothetical protein